MRTRWIDLPLKTKLTFLYLSLLVALFVSAGIILYIDTKHFLITSTALRLRAQAKPVIERWLATGSGFPPAPPPPPAPPGSSEPIAPLSSGSPSPVERLTTETAWSLARALTSRDTTALILDIYGDVLACGRLLPEEPSPVSPDPQRIARALKGDNEVTYITTQGGERELVVLIPLRHTPTDPHVFGVVQLNTPLNLVERILWRQRTLILMGVFVTLFIGAAGGLWITGSTLAPLKRMITTCRQIASGDLSRRVSLPQRRDEVGQLAAAFNEMVDHLEKMFMAQQRFVAAAAHELRSPLAAIRGSLEILLRGALDERETAMRLIQGTYREVTRLGHLAEQLLSMMKIGTPVLLHRQWVEVKTLLEDVIKEMQLLASDRDLILTHGPEVALCIDVVYFKQVLLNLVDNAIRHTEQGGRIELGWAADSSSVRIWVADDGEGISPEDLPHIFEPFYRGRKARSSNRKGVGLGLALSKAIVEAHNGTISVTSTLGKGTRFVITLPRETQEASRS